MTPTTHHTNNITFSPPEGMTEEECSTIRGTIIEEDGQQMLVTFWKPDAEELAWLNAGQAVALTFYAGRCPVHAVSVATADPVAS